MAGNSAGHQSDGEGADTDPQVSTMTAPSVGPLCKAGRKPWSHKKKTN